MLNKSETIGELAKALNKAQSEMGGAHKGANNPFFKSKYADLGAVVEAVKEPFANNGLSYSQFPIFRDGLVGVETILMHESGEWLSGELLLPMTKQDPQAAGSAITYARRYGLQAVAGIPAEDDDGNSASGARPKAAKNQPVKKFEVDDIAKEWIALAKSDAAILNQIEDPEYKAFIQQEIAA